MKVLLKTAYTDKGNQYTKSNVAKTTGLVALGAMATKNVVSALKTVDFDEMAKTTFEQIPEEVKIARKIDFVKFAKQIKLQTKASAFTGVAIVAAVGLGVGAIVDGIINKISKVRANKAALKAE